MSTKGLNIVFPSLLKWVNTTFLNDLITGTIQLTLYAELDGGVGHPHHVLCDAGQLEVVVVSADVEQSQVDGVDVGPVHVGLWTEDEQTQRCLGLPMIYCVAHTLVSQGLNL